MTRIITLLLVVTACAAPQTTETKEDSVAVLSEDTLEMATDDESTDQIPPVDTIFAPVRIEKRASASQMDKDVVYVYKASGLDVFSDAERKNKIGHVDYKGKVNLRDGFVDPEYVLPLPVPETTNVLDYFTANVMLLKDPVERKSKASDEEGSFSFIDYEFEGGYKIISRTQYESGDLTVKLPGFNIRQAYLFASYFYEEFDNTFEEFPTGARDEELPEQKHVYVRVENGEVLGITVGNGEGCYWEDGIAVTGDGAEMNSSGGC